MRRSIRTPATAVLALLLAVGGSGCQALESLGIGGGASVAPADEPATDAPVTEDAPVAETDTAPVVEEGLAVPACDALYSETLTTAFLAEERVSRGDTSEGDFGFGTTNLDLVSVLKNVRNDLRVSCTWYLPASESVSVTSVALISSDTRATIEETLIATGASKQESGGGTLFSIASTTSDISPDYIATETHFLTDIVCPSTLAESSCAAWVTSNYAFGKATPLTVDAAAQLGVYSN